MMTGLILVVWSNFITAAEGEISWRCCTEVEKGACQELTPDDSDDLCLGTIFSIECKEVPQCTPGCCVSSKGVCTPSPSGTCGEEGTFYPEETGSCLAFSQCNQGCCILKDGPRLITDQECSFLSGEDGIEKDFRGNLNT